MQVVYNRVARFMHLQLTHNRYSAEKSADLYIGAHLHIDDGQESERLQ